MAAGRQQEGTQANTTLIAEVGYDLQAGSYKRWSEANPSLAAEWGQQCADLLAPWLSPATSLLEVGTGDGTTLSMVLPLVGETGAVAATDISWSRCSVAREILSGSVEVVASDLFHLPLPEDSVDVLFTAHALEPNGGRELEALAELVRVARKALVLIEPIYEMSSSAAQERMREHGYVRNLEAALNRLPVDIVDFRQLDLHLNPLNPAGVIVATPTTSSTLRGGGGDSWPWSCPAGGQSLLDLEDCYFNDVLGIAYPVFREVPLLRSELGFLANRLSEQV